MQEPAAYPLGDVVLQSGATLWQAKVAYTTYGTLNGARDNVVLIPTFYAGHHTDVELMMSPGRAIDPAKHFVIVPNMLGNGLSSSPSNTPPPLDRAAFPRVTVYDNVICQHRLVTERLGIERIRLVTGFSMGAQQAFQWGALFPEMVAAIAPICGTACTSPHNFVFLEGLKAALTADAAFNDGWYGEPPVKGLIAFARVYAGWVLAGFLSRPHVSTARTRVDRRCAAVLRGALSVTRRERSAVDVMDLAACRHQRKPAIQRRLPRCPGRDRRSRDRDAEHLRSLFPCAGQRARGGADAKCRAPADTFELGARRRPRHQSGRQSVH
jgi:homoserine acetyltransferase